MKRSDASTEVIGRIDVTESSANCPLLEVWPCCLVQSCNLGLQYRDLDDRVLWR